MVKSQDMLIISIFTLITVIVWIVFEVHHAAVISHITDVQQKLMTPLNPQINPRVLEQIRSRKLP